MNRTICLASLIMVASAGLAQDGWKRPDTIKATVTERMQSMPERTFTITKKGSQTQVLTSAPISGELEGTPRVEVSSEKGVYTWIEGKPELSMRLFWPTTVGMAEALATPAFSRGDLEFHLKGIEKTLDKRVLPGKEEAIAGRMCLVLNVLDRPDSVNKDYQKLWIDKETGLTMKQEDYFGGVLTFTREISSIDLRTKADAAMFAPSANSVVIRGVVSPRSLINGANLRGADAFKNDIAGINAKTLATQANWASAFDPTSPFGYAQTSFRQIARSQMMMSQGQNSQDPRAQQQQRQRANRLAQQAERRVFMQSQGGETVVIAVQGQPADLPPGAQFETTFTVDAGGGQIINMTGLAGDLDFFPAPPNSQQGGSAANNNSANTKPILLASSDMLDPKTGDTVNFVQAHNGGVEGKYAMFVLGQPKEVKSQALSECKSYSATVPYSLNVITWRKGDVRYGLSSTNLTVDQLVAIASKIK